ncbi:MAG: hypothetical protein QOI12_2320 [Alphaproteobacteria bacterium]|nr:hypothetical protein [Alphaproteobacteria bacterium]
MRAPIAIAILGAVVLGGFVAVGTLMSAVPTHPCEQPSARSVESLFAPCETTERR